MRFRFLMLTGQLITIAGSTDETDFRFTQPTLTSLIFVQTRILIVLSTLNCAVRVKDWMVDFK